MTQFSRIASILGVVLGIVMFQGQGCQGNRGGSTGGTSTGNPFVALRFSGFTASSKARDADSFSSQSVTGNVQEIKMCFKRLRLRAADAATSAQDLDLQLGEISLQPNGTDISSVVIPDGAYERIEFELDNDCASGKSLTVVNDNGSFSTNDRITIRFEGLLKLTSDKSLTLLIQQIVGELSQVTNSSNLKTRAEAASGTF
jgi:hypothetical protein